MKRRHFDTFLNLYNSINKERGANMYSSSKILTPPLTLLHQGNFMKADRAKPDVFKG